MLQILCYCKFISRVKCWTAFTLDAESGGFMQSSLLLIIITPDFHDIEDLMAITDVLH